VIAAVKPSMGTHAHREVPDEEGLEADEILGKLQTHFEEKVSALRIAPFCCGKGRRRSEDVHDEHCCGLSPKISISRPSVAKRGSPNRSELILEIAL
jgi:hypothetical protein